MGRHARHAEGHSGRTWTAASGATTRRGRCSKPVAHGTTNPCGLDWDEYGEMFITNCVIDHLFHVVPGGHYERMYGQDVNPHAYGLMKSCVDHMHWAGGDWTSSRTTGVGGKPNTATRAAATPTRAARSTSATTSRTSTATRSSPATSTAIASTTTSSNAPRAGTRASADRTSCSRTTPGSAASA